jgi:hypothetical protein
LTDISDVLAACIIRAITHCPDDGGTFGTSVNFIALMMGAVNTSETSVSFYQTTRLNIP